MNTTMSVPSLAPSVDFSRIPTFWAALACFLSAAVFIFLRKRSEEKRIRKYGHRAPSRYSWAPLELDSLVAALSQLYNDTFFDWIHKLLQRFGHTIEFNLLANRIIMTDDQTNLRAIFSTDFSTWEKGDNIRNVWSNVLGNSIFTTDGAHWRANKGQLRGHLSKARPDDLIKTEIEFQELRKHLTKKEPQDVYDLLDRYCLDVVTRIFFGKSAGCLTALNQNFRQAVEFVFKLNTYCVFIGPLAPYVPVKLIAGRSMTIMNSYIGNFVDDVLSKSPEELKVLPEKDLNLVEKIALTERNPKVIKDQLLAVVTAGKDPVAMVGGWALYELARNPKVFQKLEHEIASISGFHTPPTSADLKEMPYLKCVVRETLRIHHMLGFNIRTANEDTSLPRGGGPNGDEPIGVLKGTQCVYSIMSMQLRTDIWGPDAAEWKPERWENYTQPMWDFIPYNHGPRICLGQVFGTQQLEYVIARIVQDFGRLEPLTMEPMKTKVEMNTKMASPCLCNFHEREKMPKI